MLQALRTFLLSQDFAINFFANLGGALFGVLLALLIDRRLAYRSATRLYGHVLLSVRSELNHLRPHCEVVRDRLNAGDYAILLSLSVPATRTALVNPLFHERAPDSLVRTLAALSSDVDKTDEALRDGLRRLGNAYTWGVSGGSFDAASQRLMQKLARDADRLKAIIDVATELVGAEISSSKVEARLDLRSEEVQQKLDVLLKRQHSP